MDIEDKIKELVEEVLGSPKREYAGSGTWFEFDCPNCAAENCGTPDGKHNLAVNVSVNEAYYHCWRCEIAGRLSNLFKRYGTPALYKRYKDLISEYKSSHLYEIGTGDVVISDDPDKEEKIILPDKCFSVFDGTQDGNKALAYLHQRGVDDFLIKKHGIRYVGNIYGNGYRNMVIIPSYNLFGDLNYFSGRDFTGKKDFNKKNPHIKKTEIVFNEGLINWYEPITLVEGPFDHIVTPNSIPLLGKTIDETYLIYKVLNRNAKSTVNLMLDSDARVNALKNYKKLNSNELFGRVRVIDCPDGYDPSDIYKDFGKHGMLKLISSAHKLDDYVLSSLAM